jgi:hypothetical protein
MRSADCHPSAASLHAGTSVESIVQSHTNLACQVCHIPTIARKISTMVDWRWGQAGLSTPPVECAPAPAGGRATYSKQKGCFIWKNNVRPELRYTDGKWNRMVLNVNKVQLPVDLASPTATYKTPGAKIRTFKKMVGNQPADAVNQTVLVPNLFGNPTTDPDAFWVKFISARSRWRGLPGQTSGASSSTVMLLA